MGSSFERLSYVRDRYSGLVSDRFYAMVASTGFVDLQKRWLRAVRRTKPFPTIDGWVYVQTIWKDKDPGSFKSLEQDVEAVSRAFALAPWHVLWAIFVKDHQPGSDLFKMFPMDVKHPSARILVEDSDIRLAEKLNGEATNSDVYIEWRPAEGVRGKHCFQEIPYVAVNIPIECPPELARFLCSGALRVVRRMLRNTGIPMPYRARQRNQDPITASIVFGVADLALTARLQSACDAAGLAFRSEMPRECNVQNIAGLYSACLEVRFPPTVRSSHLSTTVNRLIRDSRSVMRAVGLDLGNRLRSSTLSKHSRVLKVDGHLLPKRGLGDLAEDLLDEFPAESGDLTPAGRNAKAALKSRRNKVKNRFMKKGLIPLDMTGSSRLT